MSYRPRRAGEEWVVAGADRIEFHLGLFYPPFDSQKSSWGWFYTIPLLFLWIHVIVDPVLIVLL